MNARLRQVDDEGPRTPPASVEAERNVLGALMLDPKAMAKIRLAPEDFHVRHHQALFRALLDMDAAGQPLDAVTVSDWVTGQGIAGNVGGPGYVCQLAQETWSIGNVVAYADIVRDKARLRRVIEVASGILHGAFSPDGRTATEIVDSAVGELMALAKSESNCDFSLRQAIRQAWDDVEYAYQHQGELRGVTTGFPRMDARFGGWHRGDLIFLAARPSMGKTALMVNMALSAAGGGFNVGMISGEQSAMQIGQRSLAVDSRVPAEIMRNGLIDDGHWPKLNAAMVRLIERKVRIYDRSAPTLEEIVRVGRRWKQEHGLDVLFVDYLQRVRVRGAESRIEEVSEAARGLKTLARDLDIPVVCLAQVKAEVDKRGDPRPGLGDIANSDEATREADLIAFLYRPEVYTHDVADAGKAELNVEKNRHGPTGQFDLYFAAESMTFGEAEGEERKQRRPKASSGRDKAAGSDR